MRATGGGDTGESGQGKPRVDRGGSAGV